MKNVKHIDVTMHATGAKIGTYTVFTGTLTEQQVADYVDDGGIGSLADCCDWDGPESYEWTGDEVYEVRA
jgi:hypothetical protein